MVLLMNGIIPASDRELLKILSENPFASGADLLEIWNTSTPSEISGEINSVSVMNRRINDFFQKYPGGIRSQVTNWERIDHLSIGDEQQQFDQIPICCA